MLSEVSMASHPTPCPMCHHPVTAPHTVYCHFPNRPQKWFDAHGAFEAARLGRTSRRSSPLRREGRCLPWACTSFTTRPSPSVSLQCGGSACSATGARDPRRLSTRRVRRRRWSPWRRRDTRGELQQRGWQRRGDLHGPTPDARQIRPPRVLSRESTWVASYPQLASPSP